MLKLIILANQDILYELWNNKNLLKNKIRLDEIGRFADKEKNHLKSSSKTNQITPSGLNYAVLKFIIDYCRPYDWPEGRWEQILKSKHPKTGNYSIWRRYPRLRVNILEEDELSVKKKNSEILKKDFEALEKELEDAKKSIAKMHEIIEKSLAEMRERYYQSLTEMANLYEKGVIEMADIYKNLTEKLIKDLQKILT